MPRQSARVALVAVALSLAFATAGCESMDIDKLNPFAEKEKKLPGTRAAVFPEGVPGVDYNAPPPQPANSGYDYSAPAAPEAAAGPVATTPAQAAAPAR